MSGLGEVLERLAAVIASRAGGEIQTSWSARLIADPPLAAKKLAEEGVELALAAVQGDRLAVITEGADVLYHFLVLLAASGVSPGEVAAELARREGRSGIAEKAARQN